MSPRRRGQEERAEAGAETPKLELAGRVAPALRGDCLPGPGEGASSARSGSTVGSPAAGRGLGARLPSFPPREKGREGRRGGEDPSEEAEWPIAGGSGAASPRSCLYARGCGEDCPEPGLPVPQWQPARPPRGSGSSAGMSSGTMKFNGYLRVRIGEAVGLQPTRWSLRHSLFKKGHQLLDPYLTVSVDQVRVGQTSTKQKTNKPTYNEEFCANVTDGGHLELAVFHETPLGYDHFVANCTLQFQELLRTAGTTDTFEGWVSSDRLPRPFMSAGLFLLSIFKNSSGSPSSSPCRGRNSLQTLVFSQVACSVDATAVGVCGRRCDSGKPSSLWTWTLHLGKAQE